ncbi:MAG: phosphonoacetaldehyde hydrolase [Candidatus Synoicihabitans palmerolidicus]|nr:phosphonoacetaldehyde hydrolase [Candidatus Synoicihabitans palmerolidicus]
MNIQGLILDWAGTAVDFGSQCPVSAFQHACARRHVTLSAEPVHRLMGTRKRDHLRSILGVPEVAQQWLDACGKAPTDDDIEALYLDTENMMVELVPGLLDAVVGIRRRGLKIGSPTGYTSRIMEPLTAAATHGYAPDHWVAADQVRAGRPWPWMLFANLEKLSLCPSAAVVKIGDTFIDLEEGRNAGTWNISVISSSVMGLSPTA